jgi:hypothetical protein
MREMDFANEVAKVLKQEGFNFTREVSMGGLRPDFIVRGPDDQLAIVEVKRWGKRPGFASHAAEQARLYKEAAGADGALVVMSNLDRNMVSDGVVTIKGVGSALRQIFSKPAKRRSHKEIAKGKPGIFVAMPFSPEYEDVFFVAMAPAADALGATCIRVDRQEFVGDVVAEIRRRIRRCVAAIVDMSEARPNVLYEAGMIHALRRPAIHVC